MSRATSKFYSADAEKWFAGAIVLAGGNARGILHRNQQQAAMLGELGVLKYLCSIRTLDVSSLQNNRALAQLAAAYSRFTVLKWLFSLGLLSPASSPNEAIGAPLAANGNLEMLQWAHERNLLNAKDARGRNPSHAASAAGRLVILQWLCSQEILDLDTMDVLGYDVATLAATNGHLHILQWLYAQRLLDVSPRNESGWKIANTAAKSGRLEVLIWLNEPHIDLFRSRTRLPVESNPDQKSRLDLATVRRDSSEEGTQEMAHLAFLSRRLEILIWMHGEDLLPNDELEKKYAFLAAKTGELAVLRWLHVIGALNAHNQDADGLTIAHHVIPNQPLHNLQWLSDNGLFDARIKDNGGKTVAHLAASHGCLTHLQWLHSIGQLDMTEVDAAEENVTHCAYRHFHVLDWLLSVGLLDVNVYQGEGMSIAHRYAIKGDIVSLEQLHSRKLFDPKFLDVHGWSVAHFAAYCNHLPIIKWLYYEDMLDTTQKDEDGDTVVTVASPTVLQWFESVNLGSK